MYAAPEPPPSLSAISFVRRYQASRNIDASNSGRYRPESSPVMLPRTSFTSSLNCSTILCGTPPPETTVSINAARTIDGSMIVEIADLGIGMSPADILDANERLAAGAR